jgi:hypothetical protein
VRGVTPGVESWCRGAGVVDYDGFMEQVDVDIVSRATQWVGGVPITNNLKLPIIIPRALVDSYGLDGNGDVFYDEGVVCQDVVSNVIAWGVGDTINVEGVCQDEGRDIYHDDTVELVEVGNVKPGLVSRYSYGMSHLCQCSIYSSACLFLSLYNF